MKTARIGKHIVELYDSIEDLPIVRFHKYNKMMLVDAGIGGEISDFEAHLEKIAAFIRTGDSEKAIDQLNNMKKSVWFIQSELSPKYLAFAALITKIDGKECNDLSDDGLQRVVAMLNDAENKQAVSELEAAKKKIENELQTYFPQMFESAIEKEYYDTLKKRTIAQLNRIMNRNEDSTEVDTLTDKVLTFVEPPIFEGLENAEIKADKQFERMLLTMSQQLGIDARNYTTLAFYNAYEYLKETLKKKQSKK